MKKFLIFILLVLGIVSLSACKKKQYKLTGDLDYFEIKYEGSDSANAITEGNKVTFKLLLDKLPKEKVLVGVFLNKIPIVNPTNSETHVVRRNMNLHVKLRDLFEYSLSINKTTDLPFLEISPNKEKYLENEKVTVKVLFDKLPLGVGAELYVKDKKVSLNEENAYSFSCSDALSDIEGGKRLISIKLSKVDIDVVTLSVQGVNHESIGLKEKYNLGSTITISLSMFDFLKESGQRLKSITFNGEGLDLTNPVELKLTKDSILIVEKEDIPVYKIFREGDGKAALVIVPEHSEYIEGSEITLSVDETKIIPNYLLDKVLVDDKEVALPYKFKILKNVNVKVLLKEKAKVLVTVEDTQNLLNVLDKTGSDIKNKNVYLDTNVFLTLKPLPNSVASVKVLVDDVKVVIPYTFKLTKAAIIKVEVVLKEKVKLTVSENLGLNPITTVPENGEVYKGDSVVVKFNSLGLGTDYIVKGALLNNKPHVLKTEETITLNENSTLTVEYRALENFTISLQSGLKALVGGNVFEDASITLKENTLVKFKYTNSLNPGEVLVIKIDGQNYQENTEHKLIKNINVTYSIENDPNLVTQITLILPEGNLVSVTGLKEWYLIGTDKIVLQAKALFKIVKIFVNDKVILVDAPSKEVVITKNMKIEVKLEDVLQYKQEINLVVDDGVENYTTETLQLNLNSEIIFTLKPTHELEEVKVNDLPQLIIDVNEFRLLVTESVNTINIKTKKVRTKVLFEILDATHNGDLVKEYQTVGDTIKFSAKEHFMIKSVTLIESTETKITVNSSEYTLTITENLSKFVIDEIFEAEIEILEQAGEFTILEKTVNNYYLIGSTITLVPAKYKKFTRVLYSAEEQVILPNGNVSLLVAKGKDIYVETEKTHIKVTLVGNENVDLEDANSEGYYPINSELKFIAKKHFEILKYQKDTIIKSVYDEKVTINIGDVDTTITFTMYLIEIKPELTLPSNVLVEYNASPDGEGYYKRGTILKLTAPMGHYFKEVELDGALVSYDKTDHVAEIKLYLGFDLNYSVKIVDENNFYTKTEITKKISEALTLNDPVFSGKVFTSFKLSENETFAKVYENVTYSGLEQTVVIFEFPGLYYVEAKNDAESILYEVNVEADVAGIKLAYSIKTEELNRDFYDYASAKREVGFNNGYKPNILAISKVLKYNETENRIDLATRDVSAENLGFTYDLTILDISHNEYYNVSGGVEIKFKEEYRADLLDKLVKLKIKYSTYEVTEEFKVVDGHNAYNDLELRNLFKDKENVGKILLQRDIVVEIQDYQQDIWTDKDGKRRISLINGGSNYEGSFYVRSITDSSTEKFADFNGNFYLINAENIPLVKPADYANEDGQYWSGTINDITSSLFRFENHGAKNEKRFKIKNIKVKGNTNLPAQHGGQMNTVAAGSAGIHGYQSFTTSVEFDNFNMSYFVIGIYLRRGTLVANHIKSEKMWGSAFFYSNGYEQSQAPFEPHVFKLLNSHIKDSGGPSLFILDYDRRVRSNVSDETHEWENACNLENTNTVATPSNLNGLTPEQFNRDPYTYIENVEIDNYMTGNSTWFTSNGFSAPALVDPIDGALSSIYGAVSAIPYTKTVYKQEGQEKHFNFMIYMQNNNIFDAKESSFNDPYSGTHSQPQIDFNWKYNDAITFRSYRGAKYKHSNPVISGVTTTGGGVFLPLGSDFANKLFTNFQEILASQGSNPNPPVATQQAFGKTIIEGFMESDAKILSPEGTNFIEFIPNKIPIAVPGMSDDNFPGLVIISVKNKLK